MRTAIAPAKVNLYLHVGPPNADGRHAVSSLAVFADVGDTIAVERAATASLEVTGPFAGEVGEAPDNLITRALMLARAAPMKVRLHKTLPVASGLGGGTSDAATALRLALELDPDLTRERIEAAARALGADGTLCLHGEASISEGEGELLSPAPGLPPLHAVLVNPGVPSPTGAVYRAYDDGGGAFSAQRPDLPDRFGDLEAVIAVLTAARNDLEAPAARLEPRIGEAIDVVRGRSEVRFARMSGSGATVFGLCEDQAAARAAAHRISATQPDWWVVPTVLK